MRNNNFNLVFLHHNEVFSTREKAIAYLNDFYKPNSLDAEPIIVKYGDVSNPNVILGFGTSNTSPGSFYAIDMSKTEEELSKFKQLFETDKDTFGKVTTKISEIINSVGLTLDENKITNQISYNVDVKDAVIGEASSISNAIDLLSKYIQKQVKDNKLTVENTKTVKLIYDNKVDGGKTLKADVNISTDGDSDENTFNDNIIGIKPDGVYAAVDLTYDDSKHELVFSTSGYKNGRFQDDANVQKVFIGENNKLQPENDGKTVKLVIEEDPKKFTGKISAEVQISDNEESILEKKDGKLIVIGTSKKIKHDEGTVDSELKEHTKKITKLETKVAEAAKSAHIKGSLTETVTTNVDVLQDGGAQIVSDIRLGTQNTIVVKNGGLEVNIDVDIDSTTNTLIVTLGDKRIIKKLPGVDLIERSWFDDKNFTINFKFKGSESPLVIPVRDMLLSWKVDNKATSPIVLTKENTANGELLSADVTIRTSDNLLSKGNGALFVSEMAIDRKIQQEASRASQAERQLRDDLRSNSQALDTTEARLSENITRVAHDLTQEISRAKEEEGNIKVIAQGANTIASDAKTLSNQLSTTVSNLTRDLTQLETNVTNLRDRTSSAETNLKERLDAVVQKADKSATDIVQINNNINRVTDNVTNEIARAKEAELQLTTSYNQLNNKVTNNENILFVVKGNESEVGSIKNAVKLSKDYTNEKLQDVNTNIAKKANAIDVYTKSEIDSKNFLTAHQDISMLATTESVNTLSTKVNTNENLITAIKSDVKDIKFVTKESDTVTLTMDKQIGYEHRTLISNVKVKSINPSEGNNIIKKDSNGLFATVTLNYDKATNTLKFNDGNGEKSYTLNNNGILQDALYDSANKQIVLVVKKDDSSTNRLVIPVGDLVNNWDVSNKNDNPITLVKTTEANGDKISATLSILNNANNLLKNENGSLFVDGDSNKHIALFGSDETTVQGAINTLKERTDGIAELKSDLQLLKTEETKIKSSLATLQTLSQENKEKITRNQNSIDGLQNKQSTIDVEIERLTNLVNKFDEKINNAVATATKVEKDFKELKNKVGDIDDDKTLGERVKKIEAYLTHKLIDFGTYQNP